MFKQVHHLLGVLFFLLSYFAAMLRHKPDEVHILNFVIFCWEVLFRTFPFPVFFILVVVCQVQKLSEFELFTFILFAKKIETCLSPYFYF